MSKVHHAETARRRCFLESDFQWLNQPRSDVAASWNTEILLCFRSRCDSADSGTACRANERALNSAACNGANCSSKSRSRCGIAGGAPRISDFLGFRVRDQTFRRIISAGQGEGFDHQVDVSFCRDYSRDCRSSFWNHDSDRADHVLIEVGRKSVADASHAGANALVRSEREL